MKINYNDRVRYIGPPSRRYQRGRDYTVGAEPDGASIYLVEADSWAPRADFIRVGGTAETWDEYTFEWDGSVPTSPQKFKTAEEARAYIDRAAEVEGPEWASRYGRIVKRTVTQSVTGWEVAE